MILNAFQMNWNVFTLKFNNIRKKEVDKGIRKDYGIWKENVAIQMDWKQN